MKLLHLADLHLGKRLNEFDLLEDQRAILEQVLNLCQQHRVDAVLLAGDVYDKGVPPADAVELLDWFLTALTECRIAVFVISGNHDSAERLDFGSRMLCQRGLHIAGVFRGALPCITLTDEYGPVDIWSLPFVKASTVGHLLPGADTSTYDSAVAAALAAAPVDPTHRNVLLAHQFVTASGHLPECAGSENAAVNVGTLDNVEAARFDAFDYVALGHIHRPQAVGRPTLRYSGSPLCYSLAEAGCEKSAVLVTLLEKGNVETQLLPLVPRRSVRHLTGPLEKLTDRANVTDPQDYIWATLTDEVPLPDAMGQLRSAYPNTLHLDYRNRLTAQPTPGTARDVRQKSFSELFLDFYREATGAEPTPAELAEVNAALKQTEEKL